ncbi:MAG: hypothetical protein MJE77_20195 [Proteobacteria bacterium]|nr:hypothetical protein [Pseudomonadota bacterium]
MSVNTRFRISLATGTMATIAAMTGVVHAQQGQPDRFFSDKVGEAEAEGEKPQETLLQGSVTSSTFFYRETGSAAADGVIAENSSPADRLYTDLRGQIDAKHISGSNWDVRLDSRVRLANSCDLRSGDNAALYGDCQTQTGLYGDNEYDLRELYVKRTGESFDIQVGRQYVLELAAVKIDGVRAQYQTSEKLSFLGFAGLYPARGSRSIDEDYPKQTIGMVEGDRVIPVAGGVGTAYRYQRLYGAVGAVGIVPMSEEMTGSNEKLRIFLTSNGYWRQSRKLDLYHFAVFDLQGSGGTGLTNLSLGGSYRPSSSLRVSAAINHVDTETLNVIAQNRLETPGMNVGLIQNNVAVSRIASTSVRVGVSASLRDERFEVSVSGRVRRRPDIVLTPTAGGDNIVLDSSQATEIMLSAVDRRSFKDFRFGASVLQVLGIELPGLGKDIFQHSESTYIRLYGSREFRRGLGLYEFDLSYLASKDNNSGEGCLNGSGSALIPACYGSTKVGTIGLGGTAFYRIKTDWMLMGTASLARQGFSTSQNNMTTSQPANLLLSAFARVAYRF